MKGAALGKPVRLVLFGLALAASLAAVVAIGAELQAIDPEPGVLCLELTFGPARAAEILDGWGTAAEHRARAAIRLDSWFIPAYVLLWILLTGVALRWLGITGRLRLGLLWAPVVGGLLDALENRGLLGLLSGDWPSWLPLAVSVAAAAKFLLLAVGPLLWLRAFWSRALTGDSAAERELLDRSPRRDFSHVRAAERECIDGARSTHDSHLKGPLVGLALSGGGIRSATFNLGLLQALARLGLLPHIDYLSSVSGGGYIAAWLSKWTRNAGEGGLPEVIEKLARSDRRAGQEAPNVGFLRAYSNYLTPRVGILSADTWTTFTTYMRNFLLNLVILVAGGFVLLLVPRMTVAVLGWFDRACEACPAAWWPRLHFVLGLLLATAAVRHIGINLVLADKRQQASPSRATLQAVASQETIQARIVLPFVLSALFVSYWLYRDPDLATFTTRLPTLEVLTRWPALFTWMILTGFAHAGAWAAAGWFAYRFRRELPEERKSGPFNPDTVLTLVRTAPFVGAAAGGALFLLAGELPDWSIWQLVSFGPPIVMTLFTLTAVLHIGLMGLRFNDDLREWMARAGAWVTIYSLGWALLFGLATYAPVVIAHSKSWLTATVTAGWIASSLAGVLAGRAQQEGTERSWHGPLLEVAPWVFVVGLITVLSLGVDAILSPDQPEPSRTFAGSSTAATADSEPGDEAARRPDAPSPTGFGARVDAHDALLDEQVRSGLFWLLAAAALPVLWVFSRRLDINEFSMHQYYRNRLVRCYLGASNPGRKPQSFTDLDPSDDEPLGTHIPPRPYHLINTALNLAGGARLSWQQRKASSFVLAPLFSGFENPLESGSRPSSADEPPRGGFRDTTHIDGMTLGTAMAISGAAVSPNMGFRSSPALTLLLTIFNVRLGWWLGNPASDRSWHRLGPDKALKPLIAELFGLTSEDSEYVYLSDGGHFENLGIYELVRRRCRFIIVSDAAADPELMFEDLGNAIRKCRIDFGVDIKLDTSSLERLGDGRSRRHCALGKIHYPEGPDEPRETGQLLYIKTTLTGDEPADVIQYAGEDDSFPHQSTADQFFSESQFESYRSLGLHIGERVFEAASDHLRGDFSRWETLFRDLADRWSPRSVASEGVFSGHAKTRAQLLSALGKQSELQFLDTEIYPEWRELLERAWDTDELPDGNDLRSGFYLCSSLIQLMETVYLDLQLDDEHAHPDNRGWTNLFRQWARSPTMQATWAISARTYGARFQTFCRRRLRLNHGAVRIAVVDEAAIAGFKADVHAEWDAVGTELEARLSAPPPEVQGHAWYGLELGLPGQVALPVGFCVLEARVTATAPRRTVKPFVLYFHVNRHLRRTGLAGRSLAELVRFAEGLEVLPDDLRLAEIPEQIWRGFRDLFESST